mgnify:FL=1|jgi:DNA recombination protein RmuC
MDVLIALLFSLLACVAVWLISKSSLTRQYSTKIDDLNKLLNEKAISEAKLQTSLEQENSEKERYQNKYEETDSKLQEALKDKVRYETEIDQIKLQLQSEKELLRDAENKLKDAFKALAGDTLSKSTEDFLKLAKQSFEAILSDAKGEMSKKEEAVKKLVEPVSTTLEKLLGEVNQIEKNRIRAYTELEGQIKTLSSNEQDLLKETQNLVNALRTPRITGAWGQMVLQRVVELAGLTEHVDYDQEVSITNEDDKRLRPDMIVHLPNAREVVVDAKASFNNYQDAVNAQTREERDSFMKIHAKSLRNHVNGLVGKNYWKEFKSLEFVIMFIPGESFLSSALEYDQELLDYAMQQRVIIATPTTLLALLKAISYGWSQEKLAQNAVEISSLGRQLYERLCTLAENFSKIGDGLKKTTNSYNATIGTLEGNLLPAARRFKSLGITTVKELQEIQISEGEVREITKPELLVNKENDDTPGM